jgi:hypothetical protein
MSVYYNFVQFNNTDQPVSCNQTDVRLVPLVNRADDYELQIIKFVLPSQSIEVFNIVNDNDYRIQYSMPTNHHQFGLQLVLADECHYLPDLMDPFRMV